MKRSIILFLLAVACSHGYSQGEGQYSNINLQVNGLNRQYRLYIPPGHDGSEPWPLVFLFHGYGVSLDWQVNISQMYLVADTAKFLIAYPQGRTIQDTFYNSSNTGWLVPGYNLVGSPYDDLEFVGEIIDHIDTQPQYAVDLTRVYATGWSNGSEMSFYLACAMADRIAAVAGVASQLSNTAMSACVPTRKMSILYLQGTADVYVPAGGDAFYPPITDLPEYWAEYNNCAALPDSIDQPNTVVSDNSTVTQFNYTGCDDGHEVLFYRINGGGHNWPGGWLPAGFPHLLPINMDIHASVIAWNFFQRHKHPDIASTLKSTYHEYLMTIFPNPTSDHITIQFPDDFNPTDASKMTLFDLTGRACFEAEIRGNSEQFDIGTVPPGMYLVEVRSGQGRYLKKLVVGRLTPI